jgi:hypothetical protein
MKTYRVSRLYRWSMVGAKVVLTGVAGGLYLAAVTHPTPMAMRLWLLAGISAFIWLFYVRLPKMPTQITVTDDGWVNFQCRRGNTRRRTGQSAQSLQETGRLAPDRKGTQPIHRNGGVLSWRLVDLREC